MLSDDATRGRLLHESSTRAFAALRMRAMGSLARIRAITLDAFCLVAIAFSIAGDPASRAELGPLLAYTLSGYLFLLLWSLGPRAESEPFNAGWTLGAFALLVGLSALSLRAQTIYATAALAFTLFTALHLRAGAAWVNLAMWRKKGAVETLTRLLVPGRKCRLTGCCVRA